MKYDIGLIAIGDEIVDGDIVNTNTKHFANSLDKTGFIIGMHISCRDTESDISSCISFLKAKHKHIVTIGGLGPTEDDLTTISIANHFKQTLELDIDSWEKLESRVMAKYGRVISGTKKQAMFPKNSKVIINHNGTANGFKLEFENKRFIYTFPGPPKECIPMIDSIKSSQPINKKIIRKSWFVKNIGESLLAEKLEIIKNEYSFVSFKYRAGEDNIELKYLYPSYCPYSDDIITKVENILQNYL
jgi:molybdenum cofactor synthesis domain-containing protein